MQPFDRWAHGTQLLKLLNEIDQCRVELDHALERDDDQRAGQLLAKFKDLARVVDEVTALESQNQGSRSQPGEQRLISEA